MYSFIPQLNFLEEISMKYFEKCKGSKDKIFAPFARLRTRRTTAAFSAVLLTTAMLIAALFFASCGDSGASEDIAAPPPPEPKLIVAATSLSILQGASVKFTANMNAGSETEPVTADSWEIVGDYDKNGTKINSGNLTAAVDETAKKLTVKAAYNGITATATVKVVAAPNKNIGATTSIKAKFGITTADDTPEAKKAAVTETFNALHEFIQADGLTNDKTNTLIALGDWIDLEGGLTVEAYTIGGGNFSYPGTSDYTRLIVVGINSFNGKNDNDTQHIVFHFKNIPVKRRMNSSNNNADGYPASEMRKYLAPVEDDEGSGKFLAGLVAAGVSDGVLWAPARVLSTEWNGTGYDTLSDKLWLPTERELLGTLGEWYGDSDGSNYAALSETEGNQAQLEYYTNENTNASRKKQFNSSNAKYWMASVSKTDGASFCSVGDDGDAFLGYAGVDAIGCAPAFCVY
jgi:hypothetical protein